MPNDKLLTEVDQIVQLTPALHYQRSFAIDLERIYFDEPDDELYGLTRTEAAEQQLKAHPELELDTAPCGTAFCVAGWTMIASGYSFSNGNFYRPGDDLPIPRTYGGFLAEITEAASLLGIDPDEAYDSENNSGIFYDTTSRAEIHSWVRFYRGEIDREQLNAEIRDARAAL